MLGSVLFNAAFIVSGESMASNWTKQWLHSSGGKNSNGRAAASAPDMLGRRNRVFNMSPRYRSLAKRDDAVHNQRYEAGFLLRVDRCLLFGFLPHLWLRSQKSSSRRQLAHWD